MREARALAAAVRRNTLRMYRFCVQARERVLGSDHPSTLLTKNGFGHMLMRSGNHREAQVMFNHAMEGRCCRPSLLPSTCDGVQCLRTHVLRVLVDDVQGSLASSCCAGSGCWVTSTS